MYVRNPFAKSPASFITGEFTLENGLTNVVNVRKPSAVTSNWFITRVHTKEKAYECSQCGKAFMKRPCLLNTMEFIPEKGLPGVTNVGTSSAALGTLLSMKGLVPELSLV